MVAEIVPLAPTSLRAAVAVGDVTSPAMGPLSHSNVDADTLRQAVELSLQRAGYLSANPDSAMVRIAVALVSLEIADIGVTVTSRIRYTVTSRASDAPRFNDVVVAECSRYAFLSWERLQHSTECSVRKNIEAFLQQLERPAR